MPKESAFPVLDVNPLTDAYRKNNIKSYSKVTIWHDSIVNKEDVKLNANGQVTDQSDRYSEHHYKYDSIGRLIEYHFHEDTYIDDNYSYDINLKKHQIVQHITGNSTVVYYQYDDSFKKLLNKRVVTTGSHEELYTTIFKYNDDRIAAIESKQPSSIFNPDNTTRFIYNKDQKLINIISRGETQYISKTTGLIDSAAHGTDKITYIYYKK